MAQILAPRFHCLDVAAAELLTQLGERAAEGVGVEIRERCASERVLENGSDGSCVRPRPAIQAVGFE